MNDGTSIDTHNEIMKGAQQAKQTGSTELPSLEERETWFANLRSDLFNSRIDLHGFIELLIPRLESLWIDGPHFQIAGVYRTAMARALERNNLLIVTPMVLAYAKLSSFYDLAPELGITQGHIDAINDEFDRDFATRRFVFCLPPYHEEFRSAVDPTVKPLYESLEDELAFATWQLQQPQIMKHPVGLRRAVAAYFVCVEPGATLDLDTIPITCRSQAQSAWSYLEACRQTRKPKPDPE